MIELEQSLNRELRIKTRKLAKLQRELQESQDYFRELVFLIEEAIAEKPKEQPTSNSNKSKDLLNKSLI